MSVDESDTTFDCPDTAIVVKAFWTTLGDVFVIVKVSPAIVVPTPVPPDIVKVSVVAVSYTHLRAHET